MVLVKHIRSQTFNFFFPAPQAFSDYYLQHTLYAANEFGHNHI